jgi:hypothetical protein
MASLGPGSGYPMGFGEVFSLPSAPHTTPVILTPTRSDPFYVHFGFNWHQSSLPPASASIFGYRELNRGLLSWRRIEYIARQYIARQTGILCRQNGVKHLCHMGWNANKS